MTRAGHGPAPVAALLAMLCLAGIPLAQAQDSFGGKAAPRPQPMQSRPPPASPGVLPGSGAGPRPAPPVTGSGSAHDPAPAHEAQDFGVAATQQLRPSDRLGGPTPTSIPGGKVIATRALAALLQRGQRDVLLLHAYASPEHLPGAVAVVPAAQGGSFDDQVQKDFGAYLQQATGGDRSKTLVLYCGGPQCWGSYNAALRAIRMGYRDVHWYRGGVEAWRQAGLQVNNAMAGRPDGGQ